MNRKPTRRHSVKLETLDEQDKRPYKYVLKRERDLLPRPRFYSRCPDASSISPRYAEFILRHIIQQRHQELEQEKVEREKRESERRRQSELPTDTADKPKRLIPVDPIISPFKGRGHMSHTDQLNTHSHQTKARKASGSPLGPRLQIPHQESTDSEDSIDSETDPIMTTTTKELIDTLTKTLKNINQCPTIPLPIFKGKKGEDPEDHILKVEDYFGVHQITEQKDKIDIFKDTLFETARKWAQTILRLQNLTIVDCPNLEADIKVIDDSPFFVRPFPI